MSIALTGMAVLGCGSSAFDVDVDLQRQSTSFDFGSTAGTIPIASCDVALPDPCGAGAGTFQAVASSGAVKLTTACDPQSGRCFVQGEATVTYPVNVLQDDDFVTKVERHAVVIVRAIDVAYAVPANSLTFDVPEIQVWVGPAGSTGAADPGVVPVGVTSSVAASETFDDGSPRHLVVADGSAALGFMEGAITDQQTIVFLATLSPQLEGGAAIPAGALQLDILPRLTLGLR